MRENSGLECLTERLTYDRKLAMDYGPFTSIDE